MDYNGAGRSRSQAMRVYGRLGPGFSYTVDDFCWIGRISRGVAGNIALSLVQMGKLRISSIRYTEDGGRGIAYYKVC